MELEHLLSMGGGTAVGGTLTLWFSKTMLQRLIGQYDERHQKHDRKVEELSAAHNRAVEKLSDGLGEIRTKLAALEVRAAEVVAVRDDVREMTRKLAVVEATVAKTKDDINAAWRRLKAVGDKE